MLPIKNMTGTLLLTVLATALTGTANAQNNAPNPYDTVTDWAKLSPGRVWGATSAIYPANNGKNIWIAERCGENLCVGSDLDPVMLFDSDGNLLMSFGSGQITWPQGRLDDVGGLRSIAEGST